MRSKNNIHHIRPFLVLAVAILAGVNVFGQSVATQTISTGFNRSSGVFYGDNTFDGYWDVTVTPSGGSPTTQDASVVNEPGFGFVSDPLLVNSKWISYVVAYGRALQMEATSTYSTSFTLSGNISNYSLHLEYTQFNTSTSVLLNGVSILPYCTSGGECANAHGELKNVIDVPPCSQKLQDGVNTLAFVVSSPDFTSGLKVDGRIFSNTVSGSALTVSPQEGLCVGTQMDFTLTPTPAEVTWNFGDGITSSTGVHAYTSPGSYTVVATYSIGACTSSTSSVVVNVGECTVLGCKDCIGSFAPIPGEDYVLSAWVHQEGGGSMQSGEENLITFPLPAINVSFVGSPVTYTNLQAKGQIIDGWQRIEEKFTIPVAATKINIELVNKNQTSASETVYFDDIRIHPFKANMKSFVYDPVTLRLSAELDANNYATFYEYDEDGALVRVKKETEKGIATIKETRNNNKK